MEENQDFIARYIAHFCSDIVTVFSINCLFNSSKSEEIYLQLDDIISYDVLDWELKNIEQEIEHLGSTVSSSVIPPTITNQEYLVKMVQEIKHRMNSLESQVNSLLLTEEAYSKALQFKIAQNLDKIHRNFVISEDPVWIGKDYISFELPIYRFNSQSLKDQIIKHNEIMQTEILQLESSVEHQIKINKQHEDERGDEITKGTYILLQFDQQQSNSRSG
jgi:hypothetical protein